jgi:hypothetical protein
MLLARRMVVTVRGGASGLGWNVPARQSRINGQFDGRPVRVSDLHAID